MGFTNSSSPSSTSTSNQQITRTTSTAGDNSTAIQTGGAGDVSLGGTIVKGSKNSVVYNDPALQLAALTGMGDVVKTALEQQTAGQNAALAQLADHYNAESVGNTSMLSDVLRANQTLAENVQTGGQATQQKTYALWIAGGLCALGILAFIFRRK